MERVGSSVLTDKEKNERKLTEMFGLVDNAHCPHVGTVKPTRFHLAKAFGKLGFKIGAEIGVRRGNYSLRILKKMGNGKMILVDPWGVGVEDPRNVGESNYQTMLERMERFKDSIIVKRMKSLDAAKEIENGSLDFIYIDAMHDFDNVIMDLINWAPKVRDGGIISGHDYYHYANYGAAEAVEAYTRCHNIKRWYLTNDIVPSWFWVK